MIPITRSLYSAINRFTEEYKDALQAPLDQINGIISRHDSGGKIPEDRRLRASIEIGNTIQRIFVGEDFRSAYDPDDNITPQALYPALLNKWLVWAVAAVVFQHSRFLQQQLPADLFQSLKSATRPVREVRQAPAYQPPHLWVDPRGYRLSDRVWQASVNTRNQMDRMLAFEVNNGISARDLSKLAERFLLPERALIRTNQPYGSDASFDGMRLARSEISFAHAFTNLQASRDNPFVIGIDWQLSRSHPKVDICDSLATLAADGTRLREPYPIEEAPLPVRDSHPQCLCPSLPATGNREDVIERLREEIGRGEAPYTPANALGYVEFLLGALLVRRFGQEIGVL